MSYRDRNVPDYERKRDFKISFESHDSNALAFSVVLSLLSCVFAQSGYDFVMKTTYPRSKGKADANRLAWRELYLMSETPALVVVASRL